MAESKDGPFSSKEAEKAEFTSWILCLSSTAESINEIDFEDNLGKKI